ncbi:MAG: L-threonylcarbamoyladenylate synthase [Victivallaceae bacterium]|nr:L-threonylcarbamoyladenylate synthase [Victivallaceae bacterium]
METFVLNQDNFTDAVAAAVEVLQLSGSVILIPTETVYGLVCRWDDVAARERIYRMKMRDGRKPLAMFAADTDALNRCGVMLNDIARRLTARFCPGPITVIAHNRDGSTTGFRIPDYPFVQKLMTSLQFPLASTSANLSGHPNARSVVEALAELTEEPDLVIDAGRIPADALASTVVDATGDQPVILRAGPISDQEIAILFHS